MNKITLLLVTIIMINITTPIVNADTGDIIDKFTHESRACAGYANTVWIDTDGKYNGATYGNYDTLVAFQTITGLGYPDGEWGSSYYKWYFFTADKSSCGGGSLDRGRQVIYFVDMLATGFNPTSPSTWKSKSVPGISIMASHDQIVCSGQPYNIAYQQIRAYRERNQNGLITGTITTSGSWTKYEFSGSSGIKELYVSTDYCENTLNNFIIKSGTTTANSITVTVPNGGENWAKGTTHTINWKTTGNTGSNVAIELLKNNFIDSMISWSTTNDGSYSWTVPSTQIIGNDFKIKITSTSNTQYTDTSNNNFAITSGATASSITVISPNGGESWKKGSTHTIKWTKKGSTGSYVKIELLKGGSVNRVINSKTTNDGTYSWKVPSTQKYGTDYKVRITSTSNSLYKDISNKNFKIY